jgi:predicted metal-dependent peptidase
MAVRDPLKALRRVLRRRSPFLSFTLEQLSVQASSAVPAARVFCDGTRIVLEYNPAYLSKCGPEQGAAVLEHEIRHVLHRHLHRRGERDLTRWNVAADYAINSLIPDLPPEAAMPPPHLKGKTAEEIYEQIGDEDVAAAGVLCVMSSGTMDVFDRFHRSIIARAGRSWRGPRFDEALARMLDDDARGEPLAPQGSMCVDWGTIVSRHSRARERCATLLRPNRRLPSSPWGRTPQRRARVVVAVDTSGSISPGQGASFLAELRRLRARCEELTIILADDKVRAVVPFERLGETPFKGRGTTNFTPAIAYANEHHANQDLLIYLTDGCGRVPEIHARLPLVWIVTENASFAGRPAVFVPGAEGSAGT